MNEQQLRDSLKELVPLLEALDAALPGKMDAELVDYLRSAIDRDWHLASLHALLNAARAKVAGPRRAV